MIIIDTPFHITFRSLNDDPGIACLGHCRKVFWTTDIESKHELCLQCGGAMSAAILGTHYKVLARAERNLKRSDFKKYGLTKSDFISQIKDCLSKQGKVMHLSFVKPAFEERAKALWMPHGLSTTVSVNSRE